MNNQVVIFTLASFIALIVAGFTAHPAAGWLAVSIVLFVIAIGAQLAEKAEEEAKQNAGKEQS